MKLEGVLSVLRQVAPEHLAEDWDQVGLHLAGTGKPIRKAMLCIDLTPPVLAEAVEAKCQLIVAYHPPIFHPLKRLADRDWKEQMLAEAVRKGIAVYSPHTALDAARPGMNDWLCDGLGATYSRMPIANQKPRDPDQCKIVVYVPRKDAEGLRKVMAEAGAGGIGNYNECSFNIDGIGTFRGDEGTNPTIGKPGRLETVEETRIEMVCWASRVSDIVDATRKAHPYEEPAIDVLPLKQVLPTMEDEQASGRLHTLKREITPQTLVLRVKKTLGLKHVKAAIPPDNGLNPTYGQRPHGWRRRERKEGRTGKVATVAVCVGAGGSLFESMSSSLNVMVDAYVTGEMQHHQVLDLYNKGKVVILAGHTNTERPFLKNYRDAIVEKGGGKVDWVVSETDVAPIGIV